jgi:type I restriction enzyme S subunit
MKFFELGELVKIDRKIASSEDSKIFPYVGLDDIEKDSGHFSDSFVAKPMSMLSTNFRFSKVHVLYGKLRPYLNKVVLPTFDGVCTTEVLPILPNENKLDRTYLWGFLISKNFVKWASSQVSGANLPRLDPNLLLTYRIPLPPFPEQQRIAAILQKADRQRRLRRYARHLSDTYLQSVFLEMFGKPEENSRRWPLEKLANIVNINPTFDKKFPVDVEVSFLPMSAVEDNSGTITCADKRKFGEVIRGYTSFVEGDVLFAKITPCMENGKSTIASNLLNGIGFGSTEFHVLRPTVKAIAEWILCLIRREEFRRLAALSFTGTAGQQRVPASFLENYIVPLPPIKEQLLFKESCVKHKQLSRKFDESSRQAEHLFQSLLQRAFQGEL